MLEKISKFYFRIKDFIIFLSGVIVSSFVVEILLIDNKNYYHIISIVCGFIFGFLSYILTKIANSYSNNDKNKEKISTNPWNSITDTNNMANKLFGFFSIFWMWLIVLFLPISFIGGTISLLQANIQHERQNRNEIQRNKKELITKIKNINRSLVDSIILKDQLILDSLQQKTEKIKILETQIDSLNNVLNKRLQNQLKANEKGQ